MALQTAALKQNIIELLEEMSTRDENSIEDFAEALSGHIEAYVKSATVVYTSGLTAPNGAVTGTFNGELK
ncbi:hypothetical protein [Leeuwenhoekiella parthenopeia]|uniref:Uncharacterized protein n=1 Tax=Leeuwenhoekiella parthenopeia TaxID=2890320 RepID=A0ABS8GNJ9_9FLAO|nr:hypothetical protein [Leeuwenhoekiella parthenopeia]MCC4211346.1 hypothetical protein [Leeuwenhoekiella parthenopeia]